LYTVFIYLYVVKCPKLYMYSVETIASISVIKFLYMHYVCDVAHYYLITCV